MYFFIKVFDRENSELCHAIDIVSNMYYKWMMKKNCNPEIIYYEYGENVGYKMIVYKITDLEIANILRDEAGVIRFSFVSLFDPKQRRHTVYFVVGYIEDVSEITGAYSIIVESYSPVSISVGMISGRRSYKAIQVFDYNKNPSGKKPLFAWGDSGSKALFNLSLKLSIADAEDVLKKPRRNYMLHPYKRIVDYLFDTYTEKTDDVLNGNIEIIKEKPYVD